MACFINSSIIVKGHGTPYFVSVLENMCCLRKGRYCYIPRVVEHKDEKSLGLSGP